mmetsp:Transcript_24035/g.56722  ORF Transcript_24035/g.56722 Transcript_24035/m.56722 type:complete len:137 (+) Transcript_24035:76-486(+)|eukprot:CAMPEP_0197181588 /NCGR_PEP_ID=MMETSP1423-20130617/5836_1 /TAXON_ID=476441 /ORGANISM="Pseudo-nitzschia heimii, Strain UNC1101" /LENGTH=136 /DNA_ID=CAMNT_0042631873 /DNA_START=34 /DNA_END=444 /DNA_ORIENTATION=-
MMIGLSRVRSMATLLILAVLAALPSVIQSQLNQLMDSVPEECQGAEDAEFDMAIGCVLENFVECIAIKGVLSTFTDLPSAENITDCEDVEAPFCEIVETCEVCQANFEVLIKCIVLNDPLIDGNVTDLVDVCGFEC